MKTKMNIRMPDYSEWTIPVIVIALHRATKMKADFNGNLSESLVDTVDMFTNDEDYIEEYFCDFVSWCDVAPWAVQTKPPVMSAAYEEWLYDSEKELI